MESELTYVREKLIAAGRATWPKIEKKTGVSERTMRRIVERSGHSYAPHYANVRRLVNHFHTQEQRRR